MSSMTPPNNGSHALHGHPPVGNGYGSENTSEGSKSPLSMSLGFLKNLTEKKTTRVDGQTPKRRGPKPDSKPALTRRQELNRQAQRTHRERKELYIKALEEEVLRLKETFSTAAKDKDALAEENRKLKQLLSQHGISWNGIGGVEEFTRSSSIGYTSSSSVSGSYAPPSTVYTPPHSGHTHDGLSPNAGSNGQWDPTKQQRPVVDHDQAGIDFVLTLERPCMDHMQFLVERSAGEGGEPCGHALMASCPPDPYLDDHPEIPFGHGNNHTAGTTQKTWDLSKSDLANLLDLSKRLNLNGEITPVMAWGLILSHHRFLEITVNDFEAIAKDLGAKSRCYGFGAVLEEFEVRDALASIFSSKSDIIMAA